MMMLIGDENGALPVFAAVLVAVASSVALAMFLRRQGARSDLAAAPNEGPQCSDGILDNMSQADRLRLQSRVANAKSAEDLYLIFDDFDVLHHLELRIDPSHSHAASPVQAFRDLVRDKVNINNESVLVSEEHARSPASFQQFFHGLVLGLVRELNASSLALVQQEQQQVGQSLQARPSFSAVSRASRALNLDQLTTHLCCHLARTRAGGDSFFCLSHIFNSPQLVITVSHTDTHPPTDLDTSADGWAFITTTSNFDVYLARHLHPSAEEDTFSTADESGADGSGCAPLVTLSVRLEEALPLSAAAQLECETSVAATPLPYYRTMSIVCFDPCDPTRFRGGLGGKTVGASVRRCSPVTGTRISAYTPSAGPGSPGHCPRHPNNNVFRRKGLLRKAGLDSYRPVDSVDIRMGSPPAPESDSGTNDMGDE
mmetsp:Transcript_17947/g.33739  ORF Transcript_17947/g.33739 Transcript_17947/m.33739 type:complete len:428 (-) Transcript_17947:357-1640(-)